MTEISSVFSQHDRKNPHETVIEVNGSKSILEKCTAILLTGHLLRKTLRIDILVRY